MGQAYIASLMIKWSTTCEYSCAASYNTKVAMAIIEVTDLSKTFRQAIKAPGLRGALQHLFTQQYRDVAAVDQINLRIHAGESVAYLGPNGAGKSTTIKMLTGILVPSAGHVKVNGIVT